MIFEYSGESVSDAVEKAYKDLNITSNDAKIKVVQKPAFLKKAIIKVIVFDELKNTNPTVELKSKLIDLDKELKSEEKKLKRITDQKDTILKNLNFNTITQSVLEEKPNLYAILKSFVRSMFQSFGKDITDIKIEADGEDLNIKVYGIALDSVIGRKGLQLLSLQNLTNFFLEQFFDDKKHITIDVNDYRQNKRQELENLIKGYAEKVLETKEPLKTKKLNSYERRVVHKVIDNYPTLTSTSEGIEPNRYTIIKIKE